MIEPTEAQNDIIYIRFKMKYYTQQGYMRHYHILSSGRNSPCLQFCRVIIEVLCSYFRV